MLSGIQLVIGLGGGRDKSLRPNDMLLYSWDDGLDVYVDLTGSSSLMQIGMVDFGPGRAMLEVAQHKRVKYEANDFTEADPKVLHMTVIQFHCPFMGFSGCHDGDGNGLTKTSLITYLRDRHCNGRFFAESPPPLLDVDEGDLDLGEWNIKRCKRKICDGHYTAAVRVLSSFGVSPYNDATLGDIKSKNPLKHAPSLLHIPIDNHHLITSPTMILDRIKSFFQGTSCGRDGLRAQHLLDCLIRANVAISDELVFSITQVVNLFLDGKCLKIL
nr:putative reverse transcriptase domain-containing protein [Tanacetum cinerariifolium]